MSAKKGSKKPIDYPGELATPIRPPRERGLIEYGADGLPDGKYFARGEAERVLSEMVDKALLLFRRFGIDPSSERAWLRLALELAVRHVPGFSVEKQPRPGRPPGGGASDELRLFLDVMQIQDQKKGSGRPVTDAAACRILAIREVEGTSREGNKTHIAARTKSLRNRYVRAKKTLGGQA